MERYYDTPGEPMTHATDDPTSPQSSALDLQPQQEVVDFAPPDSIPRPRGLKPRTMSIELLGNNVEMRHPDGRVSAQPATELEKQLIRQLVEMERLAAKLQRQLHRAQESQTSYASRG